MRRMVAAVAAAAAMALAPVIAGLGAATPAYAQAAAGLSGEWTGAYVSDSADDVNRFDVKLRQGAGGALAGTIVETNVFGDAGKALFLTSTLRGTVRGPDIEFVKTYDGSGGVSHSVRYTGRLDGTGRRISGRYDAGGLTGRFEMVR